MKPTMQNIDNGRTRAQGRQFPVTDFNYQTVTLGGFSGSDTFTFKVNDGSVDGNVATVNITVTPVNDPPVANAQSITTAEDTAVNITLTGSDVDGDPLTYKVTSIPSQGALYAGVGTGGHLITAADVAGG